jgi:cell division protein FtsI (penicillin-binding protein 3)
MSENKYIEKTVRRFTFVYIFTAILSIAVIIRIISLQYFSNDKVTTADIYNTQELEARRGSILAEDGRPLALSMPYYQIRMDCVTVSDSVFKADIGNLSKSLALMFGDKSASAYKSDITKARSNKNQYKLIGDRSIDFLELKELKEFPIFCLGKFKGGLIVVQKNKRTNPYGSLAHRTIGYINEDGGGVGLENSFNYKLEGTPGLQYVKRQLGGDYIPVMGIDAIPAQDGYDIRTTIDIDIQEAAEMALKEQISKSDVFEGGTAIVMEVSTGAIRAIANMKRMGNGSYDESYNYAIHEATEPGSTLKLAALISLLEDGYVTLSTPVDGGNGEWKYKGTLFSDTHVGGYGKLNVKEAFAKSSNVCFAKMIAEHYGNDEATYVSRITNMKIGEKYNLEIEGEGRSTIHTTSDSDWSGVTLPMMGIGYAMLLTPLHTLTFYNAVANNGRMVKPYFVEDFEKDGKVEETFESQIITGAICSQKTIREVKEALKYVVEYGTAARYKDERYEFSGKTGTAQIAFDGKYKDSQGYRKHQASFAGFFPSDDPKYSCIVVMYTGKTRSNFYGGTWATPVFKQIADKIFTSHPQWQKPLYAKGIIPPDNPDIAPGKATQEKISMMELPMKERPEIPSSGWIKIEENGSRMVAKKIDIEKNHIPDVINMGLKDALYILENEGYSVEFYGRGRVKEQNPAPGTIVSNNSTVLLKLSE